MVDLVIYHGACRDGFTAAWVARRRYPGASLHAGFFNEKPPDVAGHAVLIVDFSYPRAVMEEMAKEADSILLLDHHKTARDDLIGLSGTYFDMERSGAGIAWDYLFPGEARPWLVDYVEDRDLWRFRLPDSKAINAYLSALPFEFDAWSRAQAEGSERARTLGEAILAKMGQYVAEVSKNARMIDLAGYRVPAVNASPVDVSELLDVLAAGRPFAVGWSVRFDGLFQYSLRSEAGGVDVSSVARSFGGGGHEHAAGFVSTTPLEGLFGS